jgi:putative thioredoxin
VDGFTGALPESEVKRFVEKLAKKGGDPLVEMLDMARESLALGDVGGAAQAYAQVLQADPEQPQGAGRLAKVYQQSGDLERAAEVLGMAPRAPRTPSWTASAPPWPCAEAPPETAAFERRLAADPTTRGPLRARQGRWPGRPAGEAVDHLLTIIERDRGWNDEAARKQLLTVFERRAGSEVAEQGRRRLSRILFS